MEHPAKRKGISLVRHQRTQSVQSVQLEQPEQPVSYGAPVTRVCYSRYPVSQMVVRSTSAPKPSVNFNYPVNYCSQGFASTRTQLEVSYVVPRVGSALDKFSAPKTTYKSETERTEQPEDTENMVERYYSFEHCKEVLGSRLFGGPAASKKDQATDR
jgi:hypothetical protein